MNYRLLAHHVFLYAIIILTILNMLIMIKFCTVKCRTTDESWVSITDGFGQNSKSVTGMNFLMGSNIFHGFGFGMAKSDGFRPVAIPTFSLPLPQPFSSLVLAVLGSREESSCSFLHHVCEDL